ncbi:unnamed protein product [Rotaria sp. Silwood1]|nr:unnamed protein product [Rotaria sp. Silwood1]CAF1647878.1 unnamed protein product [Rotaria sp. Silwood1]CAF3831159.1 unnamed protein product [Rotaria sp. Silwood1]CAF3860509.1 unnamed protein product [Rotaria sp. Silwood1]CAF4816445.1 unnamed protein product [Rotaria sp. Silwood1]
MFNLISEVGEQKLSSTIATNESNSPLDPIDWLSARSIAHQKLNSSMNYIKYVRDRPIWQPVPDHIREVIEDESLPEQGQSLSSVCHSVLNYVVPYAGGNIHPRFWGWASGEGTLGGVIADMIRATININACSDTNSAAFVERTVIEWMRQIFRFSKDNTGGLFVSGSSIATIISMAVARQRALANVRKDGLMDAPQLIAYASTQVHICVKKALELLGLGSKSMHLIPVDDCFRIKIDDLKLAIKNDREQDLEISRPFRALKVWFTLKEHGIIKLSQKIADHCDQAQYFLSLLEKHENIIRIIRPISLNVVNFRFEPEECDKKDDEIIDRFNNQLLLGLYASGIALPSSTRI